MNKKGPFMAISVFCLLKYILFFSYAKVSLKKKKKTNTSSLVIKLLVAEELVFSSTFSKIVL